jgi:hypothetical protein
MSTVQVIKDYCSYADGMIGRWSAKDDGYMSPNVRTLVKPLLNLFHGERNGKRWKAEIDRVLLEKPGPASVQALMDHTLHVLEDCILDSSPEDVTLSEALFSAEQTGEWPPADLPPPPDSPP